MKDKWIENSEETNKKTENRWKKNINEMKICTKKIKNTVLNNTKTNKGKTKIIHKDTQIKKKTIETYHKPICNAQIIQTIIQRMSKKTAAMLSKTEKKTTAPKILSNYRDTSY